MPDFKSLVDKVRQMLGQHPDQADQGIKKAGDYADQRTGGRHSEQVQQAEQRASDYVSGGQGQGGSQSFQGQGQPGQGQPGQGQSETPPGQGGA